MNITTLLPRWLGYGLVLLLLMTRGAFAALQVMHGHVPEIVSHLKSTGRLTGPQSMDLVIGLPLRNREALTNLLAEIYNPASPNFHRFLTPAEFTVRFGPTATDYRALIAFARSNGLAITGEYGDRTLLHVAAPVSVIEKTFHVVLRTYQHPKERRTFFAPDVEPTLDLAVPVLAINGLDNYIIPQPGGRPQTAVRSASTDPALGSGPANDYIGSDFRNAYVPGSALTGAGQAVGLLELDGYYLQDITNYETAAGLSPVLMQNVFIDGFSGSPTTNAIWVAEVSLDIEVAIALAPGLSKVIVYEAPNNGSSFVDILHRMATDNTAKQLSSSWFIFNNPNADQYYLQFAAQGQSFFQCSGDLGAFYPGITQWADNPNVTLVSGTILNTLLAGGSYSSESTWNNFDGTNAGGGGVSVNYSLPSWQQGISMAANSGSTTARNIPDVSMVAQNVHVIYNNGSAGTFWGTSIAAPLWAAYTALINQQAVADGKPTMGFLNPAIYALAKSSSYATLFHDITTGNNTNKTITTLYPAVPGYDLCTGWGSPTINLISGLENYAGAVWVDFSVAGPGAGTYDNPYNSLALGVANVAVNGTVAIKGPNTTPVNSTITKPLTLNAAGGAVTIGH